MLIIRKSLTSNKKGKQNELIISTFKANIYSYWNMQTPYGVLPYQTPTSKNCNQIQNTAWFIASGCTRDTNNQGLQDKTSVLPMGTHLKLHATHFKQMTQTQTHFLDYLNARLDPRIN